MKKYLITGGEGFIGSKIVSKIEGYSYDSKSYNDILNTENLLKQARDIDGIFHCAAKISVPESIEKPDEYHRINVRGSESVISVAEKIGIPIVFSSSAAVYGEYDRPVVESDTLIPKSPYAENKRDVEKLLEKSSLEHSLSHIVLRYFNVYGPGQSPQYAGVITAFIMNALKGKELVIYGNGEQVRDFIFVDDIVRANVMAMEYARHNSRKNVFEIFNIAGGKKITINVLAQTIIRLTNSPSKIVYKEIREGDIVYSQADVSRAKKILGWEAEVSLEEGLKKTIAYYSENC